MPLSGQLHASWEPWLQLGFDSSAAIGDAPAMLELHRAAPELFSGRPVGLDDQADACTMRR